MRPLARLLAGAAIAVALGAAAQAPGAQERERAWRLAVLSERMGKLHAQSGQGLLAERARRALADAMRDFDRQVRAAAAAGPAETREQFVLLALLWHDYRPYLLRAPARDGARRMAERTEELAWQARRAAALVAPAAGGARQAAEASRAAVLAQRVARLHLLRRWDVRDAAASRELAQAAADLRALLEALKAHPGNGAEAAAELQVAENQHVFLERAAAQLAESPAAPAPLEVVAKAGDNLHEALLRLARLYEAAPG